MGRTFRTLLAAVALLLIAACHKEGDGRVELILEPMNGNGAKLVIGSDNVSGTWSDGDVISFNGTRVGITREDNTHAYISDANSRSVNSACFPAAMSDGDLSGSSVTMTLPSTYHYALSDGRQRLDLPMAARAAEREPLRFRHLTAALSVVIRNDRSETLVIDSLVVGSDSYRLCGDYSVNMDALSSLSPQALSGAAENNVTMVFDRQRLELDPGDTVMVMVPVLPVGEGNHFTITVSSRYQGKRYRYVKPQRTGGSLPRNTLAYAPMSLDASPNATTRLFKGSISDGFQIANEIDLIVLSEACNNGWFIGHAEDVYSKYRYLVTGDLNMEGITIAPISNFTGTAFLGNNHTIRNLTIATSGDICSLFTQISGNVENLHLENVALCSRSTTSTNIITMGGICGKKTGGNMTNCRVSGEINVTVNARSNIQFGVLAGSSSGSVTLSGCSADYSLVMDANGSSLYYGGIVGVCEKNGNTTVAINNCSVTENNIEVVNKSRINYGGLIGRTSSVAVSISGCSRSGDANVWSKHGIVAAGGLVGYYTVGNGGSISCSTSPSTPTTTVGGSITAKGDSVSYLGAYIGQGSVTLSNVSNTVSLSLTYNN